ncbi:unnamed protein product [Somion occarium]|uniref:Uncharacterized protein n=1 Tax=Somion occarium TaxID=3059160 RepID=A0ABP1DQ90_9APHY
MYSIGAGMDADGSKQIVDSDFDGDTTIQSKSRRNSLVSFLSRVQVILIFLGLLSLWIVAPQPGRRLWKYLVPVQQQEKTIEVGTVKWYKCPGQALPRAKCGHVIVPKDYSNSSAGTVQIALGLLPAKEGTKKGTVFFNPGGPGVRGKPFVIQRGHILQMVIGSDYDIVGFDPRGVGETKPTVRCFNGDLSHANFKYNTILERGYEYSSNMTAEDMRHTLIAQQIEADALMRTQFDICAETLGDELSILDGDDALINFYGGSYGSVLGQYLVNMMPTRVGRIVIDGIVDTVLWSSQPPYKWVRQWLSSTEDTYDNFVTQCFKAGSDGCDLAYSSDSSSSDIKNRIENFMDSLYHRPLAVPYAVRPGLLTSGRARNHLILSLQRPSIWRFAARQIALAMQGDGSGILNFLHAWRLYVDLERPAVSCNDAPRFTPPSAEEVVDEYLHVYHNVSRFIFSTITTEPDSGCQFWPVTPAERYTGPWNHTLNNPILILSNTADPVTPIASGRSVASLLGNSSRLLVLDSPGHCSLSLNSLCMARHIQAYFANGTLPAENTICTDAPAPFSHPGESIFTHDMSEEDEVLLDSLQGLDIQWANARAGWDHPLHKQEYW